VPRASRQNQKRRPGAPDEPHSRPCASRPIRSCWSTLPCRPNSNGLPSPLPEVRPRGSLRSCKDLRQAWRWRPAGSPRSSSAEAGSPKSLRKKQPPRSAQPALFPSIAPSLPFTLLSLFPSTRPASHPHSLHAPLLRPLSRRGSLSHFLLLFHPVLWLPRSGLGRTPPPATSRSAVPLERRRRGSLLLPPPRSLSSQSRPMSELYIIRRGLGVSHLPHCSLFTERHLSLNPSEAKRVSRTVGQLFPPLIPRTAPKVPPTRPARQAS